MDPLKINRDASCWNGIPCFGKNSTLKIAFGTCFHSLVEALRCPLSAFHRDEPAPWSSHEDSGQVVLHMTQNIPSMNQVTWESLVLGPAQEGTFHQRGAGLFQPLLWVGVPLRCPETEHRKWSEWKLKARRETDRHCGRALHGTGAATVLQGFLKVLVSMKSPRNLSLMRLGSAAAVPGSLEGLAWAQGLSSCLYVTFNETTLLKAASGIQCSFLLKQFNL